jgi:hypothetical protein
MSTFDLSKILGPAPKPIDYANQDEARAINDINFRMLRGMFSCGTPSDEDRNILIWLDGIQAASDCELHPNHPATDVIMEAEKAMHKATGDLMDLGIMRAKAVGEFDALSKEYARQRNELDEQIMKRVQRERREADGLANAPLAG